MKENNFQVAPASLSHHDVMQLAAAESIPHLDMVTFILNIHYLASCKDISLLQHMHISHLEKMLNTVDDVLTHLSARVTPHISHQSIR
ncbi:hypothetical protein D3C72_2351650 [compost metagenome]